jgi:hypothetical protein
MRIFLIMAVFAMTSVAQAGVLYQCEASDDGDTFGNTLVLSLESSRVNGVSTLAKVDTLSDYLPAMTAKKIGPAEFLADVSVNYSESGKIQIDLGKDLVAIKDHGNATLTGNGMSVEFSCKRFSE